MPCILQLRFPELELSWNLNKLIVIFSHLNFLFELAQIGPESWESQLQNAGIVFGTIVTAKHGYVAAISSHPLNNMYWVN
jgi:hypothetical protein